LEGNECSAAGGFSSNPILAGSAPNRIVKRTFNAECSKSPVGRFPALDL
jgi:hypothetical protein